ncbi:MAG: lysophospholipid acyltransferase family protein [Bacteroidales bacterium]|nr:lysophospholipid acyltransferase family protein [Bacteroidales bacterium]
MKLIGIFFTLIVSAFFSILPKFILYRFSDLFYIILYYIVGYRKKVVYRNLNNSFPDKTQKEIKQIAKKFFLHLSDTLVENLAFLTMSKKRLLKFVEFEKNEQIEALYEKNKDIALVTGHYNNWELYFIMPFLSKHKMLAIYKPLTNKYFDNLFQKMRTRFGVTMVTMKDAYKAALDYNKRGYLSMLLLIADQRPPKKGGHYWTTFLNQETAVFLGPEKIAQKLNSAIVFSYLSKIKRGTQVLKSQVLFEETKDLPEYKITDTHIKLLEDIIMKAPQYWLWSHDRWKHKRETKC